MATSRTARRPKPEAARRGPPVRRLPGFLDARDKRFVREVADLSVNGEITFLDAVRMLSHSIIPKHRERIADWTRKNLHAPAGKTGRPGPIILTRMQAAIADFMQDPSIRQISYLEGPRIGASFLFAACMAYFAAHENEPVMFYDRAMRSSRSFYEEKFIAIWQASPEIADLLPEENNSLHRQRWTDRSTRHGAGIRFRAVSDIKSDMAAKLFADEAGDPAYRNKKAAEGSKKGAEGSKVSLLLARIQEHPEGTLLIGGTPNVAGQCTISEEFEKSCQHEWRMKFSCCGHEGEFVDDVRRVKPTEQHLPQGPGLRYVMDADEKAVERVWYECRCNRQIPETEKVALINTGWWHQVTDGVPGHVGVRSWMAHSQDPKGRWIDTAAAHFSALQRPDEMQAFTNMHLARAWTPPSLKHLEPHELLDRVVEIPKGLLPKWVKFVFAGIDSQAGESERPDRPARHEIVVVGVGENMRRMVIRHEIVAFQDLVDRTTGEIVSVPIVPFSAIAAEKIWAVLDTEYETEDGRKLKAIRTCCDVGWSMEAATAFTNMHGSRTRKIVPIRGASEAAGRLPGIASGPEKGFVFEKTGVRVHKLGTQTIKDYVRETLDIRVPAPQSWTFPSTLPIEFFNSLLAEHLVELPSGRTVWRSKDKKKETGEVWDCIVYAYAAELMERKWTRFGRDVIVPEIAISFRAVEEALEAAAARQVEEARAAAAPKATASAPSIPAPEPVEDPPETPPEPEGGMFEVIRDYAPSDQVLPPPRPSFGIVVSGRV